MLNLVRKDAKIDRSFSSDRFTSDFDVAILAHLTNISPQVITALKLIVPLLSAHSSSPSWCSGSSFHCKAVSFTNLSARRAMGMPDLSSRRDPFLVSFFPER